MVWNDNITGICKSAESRQQKDIFHSSQIIGAILKLKCCRNAATIGPVDSKDEVSGSCGTTGCDATIILILRGISNNTTRSQQGSNQISRAEVADILQAQTDSDSFTWINESVGGDITLNGQNR